MSSELRELNTSQLAKTIARMMDELDRAKEALVHLDIDNFLDGEIPQVNFTFTMATLPAISGIANTLELLNAASRSTEERE